MAEIIDWRSYVDRLEQSHQWWKGITAKNTHSFSVFGERYSWAHTIQDLHAKIQQGNWDKFGKHDQERLLGLNKEGGNWALLGDMRQGAWESVFFNDDNSKTIEKIVLSIAKADDNDFPQVAVNAYKELTDINYIGPGIATRLLTLVRPDRCISLNNASIDGLINAYAGLNPLKKLNGDIYGKFLEKIYAQQWFQEPKPANKKEEMIKKFRVALLDCFVYKYGAVPKYSRPERPKLRMTTIVISR